MKTKLVLVSLLFLAIGTLEAQGPTARAVTQITSITTGVTINANSGVITTVSATTAALGSSTFAVTNSAVESTSSIVLSVNNYAGTYFTNGVPAVQVGTIAAGTFNITILNTHATNALSGVLKIGFRVDN